MSVFHGLFDIKGRMYKSQLLTPSFLYTFKALSIILVRIIVITRTVDGYSDNLISKTLLKLILLLWPLCFVFTDFLWCSWCLYTPEYKKLVTGLRIAVERKRVDIMILLVYYSISRIC